MNKGANGKTTRVVEYNSMHGKYHFLVIFIYKGYRLGYLGIPIEEKENLSSEMMDKLSSVAHGEITFSGKVKDDELFVEDYYYLGLDCAHSNDKIDMESLLNYEMDTENNYIKIIGLDRSENSTVKTKDYIIENLYEVLETMRDSDKEVHSYCSEKQYIAEYYDWLYGNVPMERLPKDLVLFLELKNKGE
jgi:hypothetical protein